ncbi:hypothetical protein DW949_12385 [Megasphaera sp. AM44-1BH]|nr:hypothetical protein DW949_12385 [Megasphaera sp. AM44-1BH]
MTISSPSPAVFWRTPRLRLDTRRASASISLSSMPPLMDRVSLSLRVTTLPSLPTNFRPSSRVATTWCSVPPLSSVSS